MALRSLLYKEWRWLRRNAAVVVLVLVVLPSLFGLATVAFQQVIPRDTPVAVVAADERVTDDDLAAVRGVASVFSRPATYGADERDRAMRALEREEVYAVFVVPNGVLDQERTVTVEMYVEEAMVPYEQPSLAIASILRFRVGDALPADVRVDRIALGEDRTLSEYLFSVGTVLVMTVVAFAYVPYAVARERRVFRRIRVEASLRALLASKLLVLTPLMLIPLAAFQALATHLEFAVEPLAPGAVVVTLLTFVYLTAVSLGISFLTRFSTAGRMVNVAVLFATLTFSSLVYPAGFFSPLRRDVARLIPVHYSMIVQRGVSLKGHSPWLYLDYYLVLVGVTVAALAFLAVAVRRYDRRGYDA